MPIMKYVDLNVTDTRAKYLGLVSPCLASFGREIAKNMTIVCYVFWPTEHLKARIKHC